MRAWSWLANAWWMGGVPVSSQHTHTTYSCVGLPSAHWLARCLAPAGGRPAPGSRARVDAMTWKHDQAASASTSASADGVDEGIQAGEVECVHPGSGATEPRMQPAGECPHPHTTTEAPDLALPDLSAYEALQRKAHAAAHSLDPACHGSVSSFHWLWSALTECCPEVTQKIGASGVCMGLERN